MKDVEPLNIDRVKSAYTDRWKKGTPGRALVKQSDEKPGQYAVRRDGSNEWHECLIVSHNERLWGTCDCIGHTNHEGACSHLIAVYRLETLRGNGFVPVQPHGITVEVRSKTQETADQIELTGQEGEEA